VKKWVGRGLAPAAEKLEAMKNEKQKEDVNINCGDNGYSAIGRNAAINSDGNAEHCRISGDVGQRLKHVVP